MVWAEMYSTEGKNGMDSAIAHDQIGNVNYYFERDECGMKSMIHGDVFKLRSRTREWEEKEKRRRRYWKKGGREPRIRRNGNAQ
uniref:Uncharacterized protein n=1 Tax=Pristionchus pacificus TaxID=54126 RepID=A0A2A6CS75_PRIPA|eukprot:PDM80891.1 hypothetical protein PRIPAC_35894 [Pristionchus pacificus]